MSWRRKTSTADRQDSIKMRWLAFAAHEIGHDNCNSRAKGIDGSMPLDRFGPDQSPNSGKSRRSNALPKRVMARRIDLASARMRAGGPKNWRLSPVAIVICAVAIGPNFFAHRVSTVVPLPPTREVVPKKEEQHDLRDNGQHGVGRDVAGEA
jgi:hypothetical protein